VRVNVMNQRLAPVTLEPRAGAAVFDAQSGRLTLHASSQNPAGFQKSLAGVLKLPPAQIRVVVGDVGGGFGMKTLLQPEDVLAAFAAKALGVPVRWRVTRLEDFQAGSHGRDQRGEAELALDAEGRILALRVRLVGNLGAYAHGAGAAIHLALTEKVITSVYHVPVLDLEARAVLTHTNVVSAYRGAGRPEAIYLIERLMDEAAVQLRRDPAQFRRINLITPGDAAVPHADRRDLRQRRLPAHPRPGIGCGRLGRVTPRASASHRRADCCAAARCRPSLSGPASCIRKRCDCRWMPTARTQARCACSPRCRRWARASRRATCRSWPIRCRSTRRASRSCRATPMRHRASAAWAAARCTSAARRCSPPPTKRSNSGASWPPGRSRHPRPTSSTPTAALRSKAPIWHRPLRRRRRQAERRLTIDTLQKVGGPSWPNGCHVCEVEVDPDTGATQIVRYTTVDDVGRVINPLIVAGQIHGGIAQAVGQALFEAVHYDRDSGQLVTGSFMDYALPRADDLPAFTTITDESQPCKINPLGAKGVGELGTVGDRHNALDA
jgi:aerobic carbon-monoxide dehydrogenase large subunit